MSRIVAGVALLALLIAAVFSIRLAVADFEFRRGTEESVARAVRMFPNNVPYLLFQALQMDYAGKDSTAVLERAAALSPMSSAPRLRLGLAAEGRGDVGIAEKWLLDAARVDHQYEPRWTLANFYFRQNRFEDFWKWMHAAFERSYGDRRPAFDLCWRATPDVKEILKRGVPPQREVLSAMLSYALELHPEDTGFVAMELAKVHQADDVPLLDAACNVLLEAGLRDPRDADRAAQLWTASGHSSAGGVWNGNFSHIPLLQRGFDWRLDQAVGITHLDLGGQGHRVDLSGKQPESGRLLGQMVLLEPEHRYRLQWTARTNALPEPTGLFWMAGNQRFPVASSGDWKTSGEIMAAPSRLTPLELWYQRPTGQARAEGWVEIREVSLAPAR